MAEKSQTFKDFVEQIKNTKIDEVWNAVKEAHSAFIVMSQGLPMLEEAPAAETLKQVTETFRKTDEALFKFAVTLARNSGVEIRVNPPSPTIDYNTVAEKFKFLEEPLGDKIEEIEGILIAWHSRLSEWNPEDKDEKEQAKEIWAALNELRIALVRLDMLFNGIAKYLYVR